MGYLLSDIILTKYHIDKQIIKAMKDDSNYITSLIWKTLISLILFGLF
jgi:hypothetical protein